MKKVRDEWSSCTIGYRDHLLKRGDVMGRDRVGAAWVVRTLALAVFVAIGLLGKGGCARSPKLPNPQSGESALEERFTREELLEDVAFLFSTIETIHPDPYDVFDPSEAAKTRHTLEDSLRDGMSRLEFWRLATPVVAQLRDGHTRLGAPEEEWNHVWSTGSKVFPLVLAFDRTGAMVRADLSNEGCFPPGTKIRRINDRSVAELVREGQATMSFERDAVRLWALNRRQTEMIFLVWGWTGSFTVVAELASGETVMATLPSITSEAWLSAAEAAGLRAADPSSPYSFSIEADGQLGYIDFRSHSDPVAFKRFLEEAFTALRDHSPRALVIDLRHNAGGSSELGDQLVEYLTDRSVRQFSRINVRASAAVKEQHRARLPRLLRWLPNGVFRLLHKDLGALLSAPNGAIVNWIPEEQNSGSNVLRWNGPVFALVGLNTFSAAADLTALLQDYDLATIVGEETGGLASSYGDFLSMPLPHSKLKLDVSTKFYVRPSGVVDRRGVVPDLLVPASGDVELSDDPAVHRILEDLATGSREPLQAQTATEDSLLAWWRSTGQPPLEYVLEQFDSADWVFLGEYHRIRDDVRLVADLIPALHTRTHVRDLALESLCHTMSDAANELITADLWDRGAVIDFLRDQDPSWPYEEYLELYRIAWESNHSFAADRGVFRFVGLHPCIDWEVINYSDDPEAVELERVKQLEYDEIMAAELETHLLEVDRPALVFTGIAHSTARFTEYRHGTDQPLVRMGNLVLREPWAHRMFFIALHAPFWNAATNSEIYPFDGVLDRSMLAYRSPVGFDVGGSPVESLSHQHRSERTITAHTFGELYDGYIIHSTPLKEVMGVTCIADWIETAAEFRHFWRNLPNREASVRFSNIPLVDFRRDFCAPRPDHGLLFRNRFRKLPDL